MPKLVRRLEALGKVYPTGKWVPHRLSEINIPQRLSICVSLSTRQKKKEFFMENRHWWWKLDLLRQHGEQKTVAQSWGAPINDSKIINTSQEGNAMCVVGPKGNYLLWTTRTQANSNCRPLFSPIDAFEPSIGKKTTLQRQSKAKSDFAAWQRKATCCENDSGHNRKPRLGSLIPPGVLTRLGSYRLPFVLVYGELLQGEMLRRLGIYQKRGRSVFQPKASELLWKRNQITSRTMGEGHR